MTIDLILYSPTGKADFGTFARNNPPNDPLLDSEGNTREGVRYCWWAGSGKFMTKKGTYDQDGNELTAPEFLPGHVILLRIDTQFWPEDKIAEQNEDGTLEQWARSKVVRYIKNNGTLGTMAGIPYYELDGVRIFRPQDVQTWLDAKGLPGHVWRRGIVTSQITRV